ncbi:MAG: phytoene desaturase family protein [Flavisolibacter sp.]
MKKTDYDAIVVGSGPNGLAAAITLQQKGFFVLLIEAKSTVGGGMRSAALTLPGFVHDVCSAVHPLAAASPFFKTIPLEQYGLEFIFPSLAATHPLDNGKAVAVYKSMNETASALGMDEKNYLHLLRPLLEDWSGLVKEILSPLHLPSKPFAMARFGLKALKSASRLAKTFETTEAKALWAGMAAHSIQPLTNAATSAFGLMLLASAHGVGWPFIRGGSEALARALSSYFISLGGKIETGFYVRSLKQLPSSKAVLFDVTPRQLLEIAGQKFSSTYRWQLKRYQYGMGAFKIDWALDAPIPFTAAACCHSGTVHIGNSFEEIEASEQQTSEGKIPDRPFVLLAQPSLFDSSRAPQGKHTAWAYCHVPNGSLTDMTSRIEDQVERFAPGFKERILARHVLNPKQMEEYNSNYIGGDINGGMMNLRQLFTRPALRFSPYRTSARGIYICSSSTPPGGGVHGMCGFHSAQKAMRGMVKGEW